MICRETMYVKFSPGAHIRGNRLRLIFPKIATMDRLLFMIFDIVFRMFVKFLLTLYNSKQYRPTRFLIRSQFSVHQNRTYA